MLKSDLVSGSVYGQLTVVKETARDSHYRCYLTRCTCGTEKIYHADVIYSGKVVSCGCANRARLGNLTRLHGEKGSPTYKVWENLRRRCRRENGNRAHRYVNLGIGFDPAWDVFLNFKQDMGERPPGMSIDRIDNTKGYSKENCRWATPTTQARNRSTNRLFSFGGRVVCLAELSELVGISFSLLSYRLRAGWPLNKVFETEVEIVPLAELTYKPRAKAGGRLRGILEEDIPLPSGVESL